jgi:transcriptional regulator with XRE-family HTH domain
MFVATVSVIATSNGDHYMDDKARKQIIQEALKLTDADATSKAIATATGQSISLVNAWRSGQRLPAAGQVRKLAKYLFPKNTERQRWLERSLDRAREPQKATLLKELEQNSRTLRLGSTSRSTYGRAGLLDQFFARFCRLSALAYHFIGRDELVDLKEQLEQDEVDIGIGIFATLDRSMMIKFFTVPLRVGLNAVVLENTLVRTGMEIGKLRDALAPEELGATSEPNLNITPVVVQSDVGGIYASKTLGFGESDLAFPTNHHYSSYGEKLIEEERHYATINIKKTPVAIVDDITAIYILLFLDKRRIGARLVFPLSNELSAGGKKKWMPEYLVSIAVKRTNLEIVDYLRDAFRLFLRTEVQMISSFYADACIQFENLASELSVGNRSWSQPGAGEDPNTATGISRDRARAWVEYTFGLTKNQLELHQDFELPWKPILQNSKRLYQQLSEGNSPDTHAGALLEDRRESSKESAGTARNARTRK